MTYIDPNERRPLQRPDGETVTMSHTHGNRPRTHSVLDDIPLDVDSIVIEADEEGREPEGGQAVHDPEGFAERFRAASEFIESDQGRDFFTKVDADLKERMRAYLLEAIPDPQDASTDSAA